MTMYEVIDDFGAVVVKDKHSLYRFEKLAPSATHQTDFADVENPIVYVGDTKVHYINSHDLTEVPVPYLEDLMESGYTILDGVEGGWKSWEGRPEFSEAYIDLSDAHTIDDLDEDLDD